jgi:molecular chaperone GrpE (heat shock protein)
MFEAPIPGTKAGDIIQVMNVGFTIGDRLLRPAQVGVSSGGPAAKAPVEEGPGGTA